MKCHRALCGVGNCCADAGASAHQRHCKRDAHLLQIVPLLGEAVCFNFIFVEQNAVSAVQVPSRVAQQAGGRVVAQNDDMFDKSALILRFLRTYLQPAPTFSGTNRYLSINDITKIT